MLQRLIRDNAGELKSADLKEYIESFGVKLLISHFLVANEQHQNVPAESLINSIMGAGALAAWASTAWSPWKGRLGAMNSLCF